MSLVSGTIGAVMGADATESAANTSAQAQTESADKALIAQREALAAQKEQFQQQRDDFEPYRQIGITNLPAFQKAVSGEFKYNPNAPSKGAEWRIQQGTKGLNRQLAARGLLGTGSAAQRLSEMTGQIYADDEDKQYNRQFGEFNNKYGRLLDALKTGQGAASSAGAASQALSAQIGQNASNQSSIYSQLGQGLSNAALQAGQAQASLYSGLGAASANTAATGLKAYDTYQKYNSAPAESSYSASQVEMANSPSIEYMAT